MLHNSHSKTDVEHESTTLPGWVCAVIGVGFVGFIAAGLVTVRILGGG